MKRIRLLIVDDHDLFRDGLKSLFSTIEDIDIVGESISGEKAVLLANMLKPDVILMDINMPGTNGVEATRKILKINRFIGIVMVTMLEDDASLFSAMQAGARGYILKGAQSKELLQTIRLVADGQAVFGPPVASKILGIFNNMEQKTNSESPKEKFPTLTQRELELLELIAAGINNSNIAKRLVISEKTVRNHITSIFSKLHVTDRATAIIQARNAGLGKMGKN